MKNNLKFPVDCRHVYGHQDGKNKKKQEKQEKALEEEREGHSHKTEAESSKPEAEAKMMETFKIGGKRQPKPPQKEELGTQQDPRDKIIAREKKVTDKAMINIACDDIATETTAVALRGEEPYSDSVMEFPYEGSRAMLHIKQAWITSK